MLKAYEVMSRSLATCSPETPVNRVAETMRDRNLGDVLIMADNELQGIVTDRDLTVRALAGNGDAQQTPIRKVMSTNVVTGQPDWSLDKLAKVMARNQIRRLPITQNGQVVGIVSLGDMAVRSDKKQIVAELLQAISTQNNNHGMGSNRTRIAAGMGLAATAATIVALLRWTQAAQPIRKKLSRSDWKDGLKDGLYAAARGAAAYATDKVDVTARRDAALELGEQISAKLNDIAAQIAALKPKAKRRRFWFA